MSFFSKNNNNQGGVPNQPYWPSFVSDEESESIRFANIIDGYEYENNKRVYHTVTPITYWVDEEFRVCRENSRYLISNHGRLYDRKREAFLTPTKKNAGLNDSYYVHTLEGVGNRYVHKLVADAFLPGSENKTILHLDGHKWNNNASNLKATNTIATDPNKGGVRHSPEEIHRICQLIVDGYSVPEIAKIMEKEFSYEKYSERYIDVVRLCSVGYQPKMWDIVKQYKDRFPGTKKPYLTDNEAEYICSQIARGIPMSEVASTLGKEYDDKFKRTVRRIRTGEIYPKASVRYPQIRDMKLKW